MVEKGTRVEFIGFGESDPHSRLEPGTLGTVRLIDSAGTIHVDWDDGSRLGLVQEPIWGEDRFRFRPDQFRVVS